MKFKLGQKVRYKRISKKLKMMEKYLTLKDFREGEDEEKTLERRESIELNKERIGYIAGRRKFTFRTYFQVITDRGDGYEPESEWVQVMDQDYKYAYLVAYDMGKTNYVLEEDLKEEATDVS